LVLIGGAGRSLSALGGEDIALAVVSVVLLALAAYTISLRSENTALGNRPRARPSQPLGLPVGTPAPDLALRNLASDEFHLGTLIGRGTPSVLVHVSPQCGPCRGLAPDLSHWQRTIGRDLRVLTIGSGTVADNAEFAAEVGLNELLVSEERAFGDAYQARATPSAVLVDADGRVAARTVAGRVAVEALIRVALTRAGAEVPSPPLTVIKAAPVV
jgi:peroxiredoxin